MQIFRTQPGFRRGARTNAAVWVIVLCIVLLALVTAIQVAHVHLTDTNPANCPLCMVQQTAIPVTAAATLIVLVALGMRAQALQPALVVRQRQSRLFIRPPPRGL